MRNKTEQKGLDLYNALRGPLSQMETTEEMDNFKIELGSNKKVIAECMKCAQINIGSIENMKRAGVHMNWEKIEHYDNLIIEACNNAIKEDKAMMTMKNAFTFEGKTYEVNEKGNRFFVTDPANNICRKRISESAYEMAFEQYVQTAEDQAITDEWQSEADAEVETRKDAEEQKNREAEENFNGKKTKKEEKLDAEMAKFGYHRIDSEWDDIRYSTGDGQSKVMAWNTVEEGLKWVKEQTKGHKAAKPRRSKDVAFEMDTEIGHVTLTAKQVDFIKHLPDTNFWENGLDSTPWCDILADEIGGQFAGKPMTVGAMISTLREKKLVVVNIGDRQGKPKYMVLTEVGKAVARRLGLN